MTEKNKNIYFDHSATTPMDEAVLKAMMPYFSEKFGNASSVHTFGQTASEGVDKARNQVAQFLNCNFDEIIFTSGATEANNLAIKGVIKALRKKGQEKMHVITSLIEHDAVLEPCMELEKEGVEVTHLKVKSNGVVDLEHLKNSIKDSTVLVSVMYVNSEIGTIMPIREIGKMIKKINEKRLNEWKKLRPKERGDKPQPIYFHTDATQAINFCNCDVEWNYIDMLSLSGHKIYGPKGIGALYKKQDVPMDAIMRGGHQEKNYRSGTLNVTGIVGLGEAINQLGKRKEKGELTDIQEKNNKKVNKLRDLFVAEMEKNLSNIVLNTDRENSTPSHAHYSIVGAEGEALLIAMDLEGIAVSTGSACASGSLKASHVLLAIGIDKEIAHYSIRFTFGKHNTKEEIILAVKMITAITERLRKMNPEYNN